MIIHTSASNLKPQHLYGGNSRGPTFLGRKAMWLSATSRLGRPLSLS